ncbi:thioredoxin family protein [Nocardioides marinquilinus]|uniref:Thioredoxin family protein n=1 Tax=Nocardioides marinquilinus TaxID=1210400 RepID=A0ABP9PMJ9_9ACTN
MVAAKPPVVPADEWAEAQRALAAREEQVAEQIDGLIAARKRMPMVRVEGEYRFEGPDGEVSLLDLFEGRTQLILYRFFFEEGVAGWPDAGCVGCSSWADGVAELGLVHARDITFAMASPAPQSALRGYAERMGWTDLPWYTIRTDSFTEDFGATDWFALNVFLRDGDEVFRTYYLQHGPMVSQIGSVASLYGLTPYGGQIEGEDVPAGWPQAPFEHWLRRHDEFDEPAPLHWDADHDHVTPARGS